MLTTTLEKFLQSRICDSKYFSHVVAAGVNNWTANVICDNILEETLECVMPDGNILMQYINLHQYFMLVEVETTVLQLCGKLFIVCFILHTKFGLF